MMRIDLLNQTLIRALLMKNSLRKLCAPLLNIFERGDKPFPYKKSHRTILIIFGCVFLFLALLVAGLGVYFGMIAALLPALVFLLVSLTALIIGSVGNDRAVSKIWGHS